MKDIFLKLIVDDEVTPEETAECIVDSCTGVTSVYQMHKKEFIGLFSTDEEPLA